MTHPITILSVANAAINLSSTAVDLVGAAAKKVAGQLDGPDSDSGNFASILANSGPSDPALSEPTQPIADVDDLDDGSPLDTIRRRISDCVCRFTVLSEPADQRFDTQ